MIDFISYLLSSLPGDWVSNGRADFFESLLGRSPARISG
jgi:hypothetical protein